jgi:hypothetical protein
MDVSLEKIDTMLSDRDAREHDFYLQVYSESRKPVFDQAESMHSLNSEISVMRVQIRSLIEKDPDNYRMIQSAILALARLMRARYYLGKDGQPGLAVRVANILANIDLPEGISHADLRK